MKLQPRVADGVGFQTGPSPHRFSCTAQLKSSGEKAGIRFAEHDERCGGRMIIIGTFERGSTPR
jgi:hypothetical protein